MALCSKTKKDGGPCKGKAIVGKDLCPFHDKHVKVEPKRQKISRPFENARFGNEIALNNTEFRSNKAW